VPSSRTAVRGLWRRASAKSLIVSDSGLTGGAGPAAAIGLSGDGSAVLLCRLLNSWIAP
jgi:hypothetical protein